MLVRKELSFLPSWSRLIIHLHGKLYAYYQQNVSDSLLACQSSEILLIQQLLEFVLETEWDEDLVLGLPVAYDGSRRRFPLSKEYTKKGWKWNPKRIHLCLLYTWLPVMDTLWLLLCTNSKYIEIQKGYESLALRYQSINIWDQESTNPSSRIW